MKSLYLFIFLGESFRLGGQHSRCIGTSESVSEQLKASTSHIELINYLENKYNILIHISLNSYSTQYDDELIEIYTQGPRNNLISATFHEKPPFGLNNLWIDALNDIEYDNYISITYFRIDLLLHNTFFSLYNPFWDKIMFPSICFIPHHVYNGDPRVSDVMLFVPAKYYNIIKNIKLCHESWHILVTEFNLTYEDLNTMLFTFHDSDTAKDYNPIYTIINRPNTTIWHTTDYLFDKNIWPLLKPACANDTNN